MEQRELISMKNVVLFDLGNTLVRYYVRAEFPRILEQAITGVQYLHKEGISHASAESIWRKVEEENHESENNAVRPLEGRLARIFRIDDHAMSDEVVMAMCRAFMEPVFALAQRYDDVLPVLRQLGKKGFRKAIISNTPWGSPANLWREEIERLGLDKHADVVVFCGDVGWRKPARQIFDFTLERLQASPEDCLFVGDDPRWDLVGPQAVGIEAILIDRGGEIWDTEEKPIRSLCELFDRLDA